MKIFLQKLFRHETLSQSEAEAAMSCMMRGEASPEEMAAFLGAIAGRGETVAEIIGCAAALRQHASSLPVQRRDLIDVCGTGGDGADTFNISTTNALLLAASGLGVAKHGNRAVSSQSGSADVLEALGVRIDLPAVDAARCLDEHGFAFLFAPLFHPAMKNVAPVRRALGLRTIFNIIGPLANPSPVTRQVVGVFAEKWLEPMATALQQLGATDALVVWGADGLDEISIAGPTHVVQLQAGRLARLTLTPEDFGLSRSPLSAVRGGDKAVNACVIVDILQGKKGATRDIVLINCAAALRVAGLVTSWKEGAVLAAQLIDSGRALALLERLRTFV